MSQDLEKEGKKESIVLIPDRGEKAEPEIIPFSHLGGKTSPHSRTGGDKGRIRRDCFGGGEFRK